MQNNIIRAGIALIVAATLNTACNTHDDETLPISAPQTQTAPCTFTVSIPATIKGNASLTKALTIGGTENEPTAIGRFDESEIVYVYNITKEKYIGGYLFPTNISENGKTCTLSGTLTGTLEVDDNIKLIYNMNDPKCKSFAYFKQDGIIEKLIDGGISSYITVTNFDNGHLAIDNPVEFVLQQAQFCFQFVDNNNQPISVKNLYIESEMNDIIYSLSPGDFDRDLDPISISLSQSSTKVFASICCDYGFSDDVFTFTAYDADGYVYKGTKKAPDGGFQNGYYYYTDPIQLEKQSNNRVPNITWTSVSYWTTRTPDKYNQYELSGEQDENSGNDMPFEISISGSSKGYSFEARNDGTIHLDNLTADWDDRFARFISSFGNLILDIKGEIYITNSSQLGGATIDASSLLLKGDGTLFITCPIHSDDRKGLCANNYNHTNNSTTDALADDGYKVTLKSTTNNNDGTYTWEYTVEPEQ